jgi:transposase
MGGLTEQWLDREVGDWHRFKNRRQISSYLGLCPSENSSGQRHQQGSVTKCGNPRLRWALAETAWRLLRFQPDYRLVKKWKPRLLRPARHAGPPKAGVGGIGTGIRRGLVAAVHRPDHSAETGTTNGCLKTKR